MNKVLCLLVAAICSVAADDCLLNDTQLVFSFLVHRHGDRTPVQSSLAFSTDSEKVIELSAPYGYGQLTNKGKQRGYELGQYIRSRYDSLLSPQYNLSEVYIRSTDSTRAKMTVLAALAAIYPAGSDSWSYNLHWTPVPYTTVPPKYDFNIFPFNCPTFMNMYSSMLTYNSPDMDQYEEVLGLISEYIGRNVTGYPVLAYSIYDAFTSQISLGIPLPETLQEALPEIEAAAANAINLMFGNENYTALEAGVLLDEFQTYASKIQSGEDTPRLRIYSAHDVNVYALLVASQVEYTKGVPKYGSAYSLELRRVTTTGKYVVVPVYLESPGDDVIYIPIKDCGVPCDYDQFVQIVANYTLDEDTWREKCNFTNDLVVDDSNIA